jgi:hypothetical protein
MKGRKAGSETETETETETEKETEKETETETETERDRDRDRDREKRTKGDTRGLLFHKRDSLLVPTLFTRMFTLPPYRSCQQIKRQRVRVAEGKRRRDLRRTVKEERERGARKKEEKNEGKRW